MTLCFWIQTSQWNWSPLFSHDKFFPYQHVDARWLCFGIQFEWPMAQPEVP